MAVGHGGAGVDVGQPVIGAAGGLGAGVGAGIHDADGAAADAQGAADAGGGGTGPVGPVGGSEGRRGGEGCKEGGGDEAHGVSFRGQGVFRELGFFTQISRRFVFYAKKDKNALKVNAMPEKVKNRHIPACGRL